MRTQTQRPSFVSSSKAPRMIGSINKGPSALCPLGVKVLCEYAVSEQEYPVHLGCSRFVFVCTIPPPSPSSPANPSAPGLLKVPKQEQDVFFKGRKDNKREDCPPRVRRGPWASGGREDHGDGAAVADDEESAGSNGFVPL
jgi:hypothetical protein